jgi:FkbM family methyltransferase
MDRSNPRTARSFAYDDLDLKLTLFLDFDGGMFLEAGANDGVTYSNTLYCERYRGWCGILVEPIPDLAAECRRNRPTAIVEQAALVGADHHGDTVSMHYCDLSSFVSGTHGSHEADRLWLGRVQRLYPGLESYTVNVPARTLSSLLDKHQVERLDLLCLDLEGYESHALRGIDFARHRPTFILVEVTEDLEVLEALLGTYYDRVAELSDHRGDETPYYDLLYRARSEDQR